VTMQTIEQRRAAFALQRIEEISPQEKSRAKYKTELVKLPARLHTSGLGQTVAFYLSAGSDKPEWQICLWLEKWLRDQVYTEEKYKDRRLIDSLTGDTEAKYRRASAEARALSIWLKRFAEAFLEGDID